MRGESEATLAGGRDVGERGERSQALVEMHNIYVHIFYMKILDDERKD